MTRKKIDNSKKEVKMANGDVGMFENAIHFIFRDNVKKWVTFLSIFLSFLLLFTLIYSIYFRH